jgi:hypothetical protein
MLGPDCILVRRTAAGYRCLSRDDAKAIHDLRAVECDGADWLFEQCRRIARALDDGQVALAQICGLRIPVSELDEPQLTGLAAASSLIKANYHPDQPRIPAGQPGGGQWTSGDDGSGAAERPDDAGSRGFDAHLEHIGYPLGQEMWEIARGLYRLYRDSGGDIAILREYLADRGLKLNDLPDVIRSVFDPPKPLGQLQTDKPPRGFDTEAELRAYLGEPPPGYEWHHIIEQNGQFRPDLTSPEGIRIWIQNTDNMVRVPVIKHYCVTGLMSSSNRGVRIRDLIRAHAPIAQRAVGMEFLKECKAVR